MFIAQGRTVSDYQRSIEMMIQVWQRWEPWLAPPKLIGLGSVCRRSTSDPESGLYSILQGLYGCLPDGCKLHLFSLKGTAIDEVRKLPCIGSLDGMACDFAARVKAREAGNSNCHRHRSSEMNHWMSKAISRIDCPQDQLFSL